MSWARTLWSTVTTVYVALLFWAAMELPERVASHFDFTGSADGWSSRTGHLVFSGLIGLAVVVVPPLLAGALTRGSGTFINVPHKDYWLDDAHPARRVDFRLRFVEDMAMFSALTGLLLIWMQVETVWANRQEPQQLSPGAAIAVGVYLVLIGAWTVWIATVRYRPPPQEPDADGPMRPMR